MPIGLHAIITPGLQPGGLIGFYEVLLGGWGRTRWHYSRQMGDVNREDPSSLRSPATGP